MIIELSVEHHPSGIGNRVQTVESSFMGSLMSASAMPVLSDFEVACNLCGRNKHRCGCIYAFFLSKSSCEAGKFIQNKISLECINS